MSAHTCICSRNNLPSRQRPGEVLTNLPTAYCDCALVSRCLRISQVVQKVVSEDAIPFCSQPLSCPLLMGDIVENSEKCNVWKNV